MAGRNSDYDAIIVGGGHNGLTCAAYLAKAGLRVLVLERREQVGGAVYTEELWPGYKVDTCSVFHIIIHKSPVVQELELGRYGLRYMDMDPFAFAPFPDGSSITFYKDLDRTCASIAKISERDAQAYHNFVTMWGRFNDAVFDVFNTAPTSNHIGRVGLRRMGRMRAAIAASGLGNGGLVQQVLAPYGQLIRQTFESEQVRAAVGWLAAQSGPPPSEVGSGDLAGVQSLYHDVGAKHPVGGSGELAFALARCVEAHGGDVRVNAPVSRIVVSGGKVSGVECADGSYYSASLVISNAHVQTTLLKLVDEAELPTSFRHRVEGIRVGNGIGMTIRCAMKALPNYSAAPSNLAPFGYAEHHNAMQLICPSLDYLQAAYDEMAQGRPARHPALVAMTPSGLDRTIVPEGKQSLYIWAQYHPYKLADGEKWADIREREAERLLDTLNEYAPNVLEAVEDVFIEDPEDLERRVGLVNGNIMHVEMSLDQMFFFRPLPELASYRTPVKGLYLTGASTHPGGGVSAMPGRNAAHIVLADLAAGRRRFVGPLVAGATAAGAAMLLRRKRNRLHILTFNRETMEQGATIGRWQLLKRLGEGSLGVTWLAADGVSGKQAALKLLHNAANANHRLLAHLEPAVKAARGLEYPGIVPVYQLAAEAEQYYIVSEYAPSPSLAALLTDTPMSVEEACRIAVTAADALAHAHAQGIIHADLKPSNILVPPSGPVRLTDFGQTAPIIHQQPSPLLDIVPLYGNAAYIAPELVRGGPPSAASDIYALGLILYQMLGGRPAFNGDPASLVQQQLVGYPPALEELHPSLPTALVCIVNAAVSKDLNVRYPSMAEFAAALREFFIPWYVERLAHQVATPAPAEVRQPTAPAVAAVPPAPHSATSTNRLTPDMPRSVNPSSATRQLVSRRQRDPIVPRPADYIKGPTMPTRMLNLEDIRSRSLRFWLSLALVILILGLLVYWAFSSGFMQIG